MDNVEKIEQFFKDDIDIKNLMYEAAYNDNYGYSTESITQYSDYIEKVLKYSEEKLREMVYLSSYMYESERENNLRDLQKKFKEFQKELAKCGLNIDKLKNFCEKNICSMSEKYINDINSTIYAYGGCGLSIFDQAQSLNEMLHGLHHQMTNNEFIYKGIPKVQEKYKYQGFEISLYGKDITPLAESIFDKLSPEEFSEGADIFSMNNKILMLMRGSGHALSVEINPSRINPKEVEVDYFIPKVCNVEKVNLLPGVRQVDRIATQTRGAFNVDQSLAADLVVDFVKKVPTDKDLPSFNEFSR